MDSDTDDPFSEAQIKRKEEHSKCEFCKAIKKLSDTRKLQLRDAMLGKTKVAGRRIDAVVIVGVLDGWGISTGVTTITNHIRGRSSQRELSMHCRTNVATAWGADSGEE